MKNEATAIFYNIVAKHMGDDNMYLKQEHKPEETWARECIKWYSSYILK